MYTGVVETTGILTTIDQVGDARRIRIELETDDLEPEESIAVSGVCLTVERVGDGWFEAFLSAETVARTTLATRSPGTAVNLERPMPADGRFHGHVVKGTVDTTTELLEIESRGDGFDLTIEIPDGYEQYVLEKGAVALDGVSLTIADVDDADGSFRVAVVPTTAAVTTLSERRQGDRLDVEVDVLAKYAVRREQLVR